MQIIPSSNHGEIAVSTMMATKWDVHINGRRFCSHVYSARPEMIQTKAGNGMERRIRNIVKCFGASIVSEMAMDQRSEDLEVN